MVQAHSAAAQSETSAPVKRHRKTSGPSAAKGGSRSGSVRRLVGIAIEANEGLSKARASQLFERVAATSPLPTGKLRAKLIPARRKDRWAASQPDHRPPQSYSGGR